MTGNELVTGKSDLPHGHLPPWQGNRGLHRNPDTERAGGAHGPAASCEMLTCVTPDGWARWSVVLVLAISACSTERPVPREPGDRPTAARQIPVHARGDLREGSAAVMSQQQPGIVFTINDSGHEPQVFALDSTGADRGVWRVTNATNVDWEAASIGPCARVDVALALPAGCLYVADVGDNDELRPYTTIYRIPEPRAEAAGFVGSTTAERLSLRYSDGPHDVEAIYVDRSGDVMLITKRRRTSVTGDLRRSLVFAVAASAWGRDTAAVAALVDSLPIVPGSVSGRTVTDAALSPDGRYLAVRTYVDVYVFATDTTDGRVDARVAPTRCDIQDLERGYGEGVTWFGTSGELLLTQEGHDAPWWVISCPLPNRPTGSREPAMH